MRTPLDGPERRRPDLAAWVILAVVLAGFLLLVASLVPAWAQVPSKAEAKCVKALNAAALQVARAQASLQGACVVDAAKGRIADAAACVTTDARNRVAKANARLASADAAKCSPPPPFAYAGAAIAGTGATTEVASLLHDVLDDGGGLAVIAAATDKVGATCQRRVLGSVHALLVLTVARFNRCKRKTIAAATSGATLRDACLALLSDERTNPDGKLAKALQRLAKQRQRACGGTSLAAAFPGACAAATGAGFDACLGERVACHACRLLDEADVLGADCDLFDDSAANGSCGAATSTTSSTSTTTASTSTSTTTSTSTSSTSTSEPAPTTTSASTTTSTSSTSTSTTSTVPPPPMPFHIAIGDTVSDGAPAPGAGRIEAPGALDVYEFDAAPGQTIFFDEGPVSGTAGLAYRITDEGGTLVRADHLGGGEPGVLVLTRGGRYAVTVGDALATLTGTYQFTLWAVPGADVFAITLDQTVSDGVPGPGAGRIEVPGARDVYTFAASAGTVVFVDEQTISLGMVGIDYVLTTPSNATLVTGVLGGGEPGRVTLPETGTYTLRVGEDTADGTGAYAFRLWTVPADDTFAIAVGDTISDGVPGAGAGHIEVPGARDVYTFAANAGTVLAIDEQAISLGVIGIDYVLTTPSNATLISNVLGGADPAQVTLPETGTYTLRVGEDTDDGTGTYGIAIVAAP